MERSYEQMSWYVFSYSTLYGIIKYQTYCKLFNNKNKGWPIQ